MKELENSFLAEAGEAQAALIEKDDQISDLLSQLNDLRKSHASEVSLLSSFFIVLDPPGSYPFRSQAATKELNLLINN